MGLPGAALDGGTAAALDINVVKSAVLCAKGGCAVHWAPVGGLHIATFRMPAATVDQVKLAREPVRCAEACAALLWVTKDWDGAAARLLTSAMNKVNISWPLVAIAK
jgi:hypothetical protein